LDDWKKANPDKDEKKFAYQWQKLSSDDKKVRYILPSYGIWSDASHNLGKSYETRAKELVRHSIVSFTYAYLTSCHHRLRNEFSRLFHGDRVGGP